MKHQEEWEELINMGKSKGLTKDQIYFLLALREVEDGEFGNEFNIKVVKHTNLVAQANVAIESIKNNEERWQRYIVSQSHMDFPAFFAYLGGPYGTGWHNSKTKAKWIGKIRKKIKELHYEFSRSN